MKEVDVDDYLVCAQRILSERLHHVTRTAVNGMSLATVIVNALQQCSALRAHEWMLRNRQSSFVVLRLVSSAIVATLWKRKIKVILRRNRQSTKWSSVNLTHQSSAFCGRQRMATSTLHLCPQNFHCITHTLCLNIKNLVSLVQRYVSTN